MVVPPVSVPVAVVVPPVSVPVAVPVVSFVLDDVSVCADVVLVSPEKVSKPLELVSVLIDVVSE